MMLLTHLTTPSQRANMNRMEYIKQRDRRQQLLATACDLAEAGHYRDIRRNHLAEAGGTAAGNVSRVLGSMDEMRHRLIEYAIKHGRNKVVAQAIIDNHDAVDHLSAGSKRTILSDYV